MIYRKILKQKFGYNLNMKIIFLKHPSIFLATYLNHVQKSRVFPYDFGQILAIENLKKHMILELLIFFIQHFGYIYSWHKTEGR
jgi:hypothetical protein